MKMLGRVTVKQNERGLLLRNGDFERVLQPGTHWLFAPIDALRVEIFAMEQAAFTHGLAQYPMANEPQVVCVERAVSATSRSSRRLAGFPVADRC